MLNPARIHFQWQTSRLRYDGFFSEQLVNYD